MKANEFLKEHGFQYTRNLVRDYPNHTHVTDDGRMFINENTCASHIKVQLNGLVKIDELKCLVESHELVAIHGFEKSKEIVANAPSDDHFYSWTLGDSGVRDKTVNIGELRKAIADVESCMEVSSESN